MDSNTPLPSVPSPPPTDQTVEQPPEAEVVNVVDSQALSALQKGKNVLVTVGTNPSVDELASALGLTLLLGQAGKHATAVFSGKIPPAIEFLDPEKTFEDSVDSLRDFIIALDKEKADKLRYKVEDEVVKVFITPYRTVIGEKDLEFSQGDLNVDVVVALGVEKKEELDKAITAHGRILHDATFITVNVGGAKTSIGAVNWDDAEASSIAEMLVRLGEQLGEDVFDSQISTAFLTGIVAETNRFSNEKTTPKVMTMSAQLMASGANQQLIASNLRQEGMISESVRQQSNNADNGEMVLRHKSDKGKQKSKKQRNKPQETARQDKPSEFKEKKVAPTSTATSTPPVQPPSGDPAASTASVQSEHPVVAMPPAPQPKSNESTPTAAAMPPAPAVSSTKHVVTPLSPAKETAPAPLMPEPPVDASTPSRDPAEKPQFGGTLNSFAGNSGQQESPEVSSEPPLALTHGATKVDEGKEDAIEEARKAVQAVAVDSSAQQGTVSIGEPTPVPTQPLAPASPAPIMSTPDIPPATVATPPPTPSFASPDNQPAFINPAVQPAAQPPLPPAPSFTPPVDAAPMPPMPPMPTSSGDGGLPPLPPMPPQMPQATNQQPTQPQVAPSFLQDLQSSQNTWTDAGQTLVEQKAAADASRQTKIDERLQNYDQAVDRNRELQGLAPPVNPYNSGSGFPPTQPPQFPQQ